MTSVCSLKYKMKQVVPLEKMELEKLQKLAVIKTGDNTDVFNYYKKKL